MIRASLCSLLTTWLVSALPCQRIADGVEPHVRDAFVAAWARLPEPWRAELADVELHRAAAQARVTVHYGGTQLDAAHPTFSPEIRFAPFAGTIDKVTDLLPEN